MMRVFELCALSALSLILGGCAQPGAPRPPSLELPKPPSDLRAARKGNLVTLVWNEPKLTTDHETVRSLGPTRICRAAAEITTCGDPVATAPAPVLPSKKSRQKSQAKTTSMLQTFTDKLPSSALSDSPDADVIYAVEVLNRNGRGAGPSNRVHIPAIRTLAPPTDFAAQPNEDGILLTWTSAGESAQISGAKFRYRIYRRDESRQQEMAVGEVPVDAAGAAHFLDVIEWEKTYLYRITAVSIVTRPSGEVQIEGDDSAAVRVVAHDIFPPEAPAGLQAVYSGEGQRPFIDLVWAPVTSADLAGYNIYRREASSEGNGAVTAMVKLNTDLVKTPSYRDNAVTSGKTYVYSASSVDVRGNESARSEEASETAPASN